MLICDGVEALSDVTNRFIPCCGNQFPAFLVANHRRANARCMVDERMTKSAFDAQGLAVKADHVTIARDYAHQLAPPSTERHLTAITTEVEGRDHLGQLPWTCLVTICRVEQCAGWADLDAVATLRTVEPAKISADHSVRATATCFDRVLAHPFVANARTPFAENATLRIIRNHRREIFLGVVIFLFGEPFFETAPVEVHLLEFTLAAAIADRAVEWMVGQ